jgi:hypothetical protein
MLLARLIVGGLVATGTGVIMLAAGFEFPEDLGEFVWQGPLVSAAGIALAGYGIWKLSIKNRKPPGANEIKR